LLEHSPPFVATLLAFVAFPLDLGRCTSDLQG